MDLINAIVVLLNYIFIPALSYGSQLALGALGVSFIYAILRPQNEHGHLSSLGKSHGQNGFPHFKFCTISESVRKLTQRFWLSQVQISDCEKILEF